MYWYGTHRKIGVGFNHPLVITERMRENREGLWHFARRLARLPSPMAHSAVEAHRLLVEERKCR